MKRWRHLDAVDVEIDADEGRFVLLITTGDDDLSIDIHDCVLSFYDRVRKDIGPYAAEAESARQAVSRGVTLSEWIGAVPADPDEDTGYALDDPKHPTYHERMVD